MPSYDYQCRSCGHEFGARVPVAERDQVKCPRCGAGGLKRRWGVVAALIRGATRAAAAG